MQNQDSIFLAIEPLNHMGRVIRAAKQRGYRIVALHKAPIATTGPYCEDFKLIDELVKVDDWADTEKLMAQVKALVGDRVIAGTYAGLENTLEFDAQIRDMAGLPHNSVELMAELLNKRKVREKLKTCGLTDIAFYSRAQVDQWTQWPEGLNAFFKPVYGAASCMVKRIDSYQNLLDAKSMWQEKDNTDKPFMIQKYMAQGDNEYIVEQEIEGELLSVEGVCINGEYHVIGITGRRRLADDLAIEMADIFPYDVEHKALLVEKVSQIHKALGIVHGPTHTEMIVKDNGDAELVEVNMRFAGADLLLLMNASFDTLIEEILCDFACGNEIDLSPLKQTKAHCYLRYLLPPKDMKTIGEFVFPDSIVFSRVNGKVGTAIGGERTQSKYLAGFLVAAQNANQSKANMEQVIEALTVDGQPFTMDANNILEA